MKPRYKIPIIVISIILPLSFFVINYDNALDDTPYDVEILFDAEEYSVNYFVVNGNTDNIEMDIPLDMIDGVFMIYVNDQVVDDERVTIDGNKVIVNYGQNIESVKLMGFHDLGGLENENIVYSLPFGMTQQDIENLIHVEPIYIKNLNNPEELILDIDSMIQVQKILDKCTRIQKLESGEIPARNPDGSYNVVTGSLPFYNNGTHYIDSNYCKWVDSLESVTYNCFEANPIEQNWYSGPNYFDNGTHHLDVQYCKWEQK